MLKNTLIYLHIPKKCRTFVSEKTKTTTMVHKQDIISAVRELATKHDSYGRLYNELVRNDEKLSELQDQEFNNIKEVLDYLNVA